MAEELLETALREMEQYRSFDEANAKKVKYENFLIYMPVLW